MGFSFTAKAFLLFFCLFGVLASCAKIPRIEDENGILLSKYETINDVSRTCDVCKEQDTTRTYGTCPCGKPTHYNCFIKWFKTNPTANEYTCPACDRKMHISEFLNLRNWNFQKSAISTEIFGLKAFIGLHLKTISITISADQKLGIFKAIRNGAKITITCDNEKIMASKGHNVIASAFVLAASIGNQNLIKFIASNHNEIISRGNIFEMALLNAVKPNAIISVKALLDLGIEPKSYERFLVEAIKLGRNEILHLLLKKIDDISLYGHEGKSLLALAVQEKNQNGICVLLLETVAPEDVNGPIELDNTLIATLMKLIINEGNVQALKNVLKLEIPLLHIKFGNNFTLLEHAAAAKSKEIFRLLLESGLSFDEDKVRERFRCYYNALLHDRIENLDLIKNFDINQAHEGGYNILQCAINVSNVKMIKKVLNRGADVNLATEKLGYPLHHAILKNKKEAVEVLLKNGASLYLRDTHNCDAKELAVMKGNIGVFEAIAKHLNTYTFYNREGLNTLQLAIRYGNMEMVKYLVNQGVTAIKADGTSSFLLCEISSKENSELIDYLLESCGANIYEETSTPDLSFDSPPMVAIVNGQYKNLEVLLKHGYNPNKRIIEDSSTLLHYAVNHKKYDMVALLIRYGADVHALDFENKTALSKIEDNDIIEASMNLDEFL